MVQTPGALSWVPGTGLASDHLSNNTRHGLLGALGCTGNPGPMWLGPGPALGGLLTEEQAVSPRQWPTG